MAIDTTGSTPAAQEPETRILARRSFPWIVVAVLIVCAVPVFWVVEAVFTARYAEQPPPCYGLGWGCSPSPGDIAMFLTAAWVIAAGGLAGVLLVTELFWRKVAVARSVVALIAGLAGFGCLGWVISQDLV